MELMQVHSNGAGPIADLSYRNYDGPLESPRLRWWVIAKTMCSQTFRKKSFWVYSAFSGWYYIMMIIIVFFIEQISEASNNKQVFSDFIGRIQWKNEFLFGLSWGQILFLVVTLLIGAGTIANDNRANALLVYLSKPCNKLDYLVGKWMGVFLPLCLMMGLPTLVFYLYGLMSYRAYGFLSSDPWLFLKLLLIIPLSAAFHASMILGVSSLFKQGRLAGATYAGIYFLTNFFTQLMVITWNISQAQGMRHGRGRADIPEPVQDIVARLYYLSIDGGLIGMAKGILGTDGGAYFGIPSRITPVPAPNLWVVLMALGVLSALALLLAWRRVRAVEVVT